MDKQKEKEMKKKEEEEDENTPDLFFRTCFQTKKIDDDRLAKAVTAACLVRCSASQ